MGIVIHHSIVITSFDENKTEKLHGFAKKSSHLSCTEIIKSGRNRYCSFFVGPSGSKEGRKYCKRSESQREELIQEIEGINKKEGYTLFHYVLVEYGDTPNDIPGILKYGN